MPDLLDLVSLVPVARRVDEDGQIIVTVESEGASPPRCCLFQDLRRNGRKTIRCRDFPMQGKPVWLEVKRQRFICAACGAVLYEDLPDLDPERRVTSRFRTHIELDAVHRPFSDCAKINGVEETFVRRIFVPFAERMMKGYTFKLPRVLGMDEKVIQGKPRFVICDVENRFMLDMQPSRDQIDLMSYFEAMPDRDEVQVITQDMWYGYREVNKKLFKNAVLVIDKFHVVRAANEGVENVRKSLYGGLTDEERKALKRKNRLFASRERNVKGKARDAMEAALEQFPVLKAAFVAKEQFYDIYDLTDRAEAEEALNEWRASLPREFNVPFKKLLSYLNNWRPHIMRYFEHRYTNGYIERLNGMIGEINQRGKGYDLDILRAKAILKHGGLVLRTPQGELCMGDYGYMFGFEPDIHGNRFIGLGMDLSTLEAEFREGTF